MTSFSAARRRPVTAFLLALICAPLFAQSPEHPVIKRPVILPPSATLDYRIEAKQSGLTLEGEARVRWQQGSGRYSVIAESRAALLGKILESKSEGAIDGYGLAPTAFTEKRFRKSVSTTTFDRNAHVMTFSESAERYPLIGGEQDRTSAAWQLAAVVRGAPKSIKPGVEWTFFVAGPRDAEKWTFRAIGTEKIRLVQGGDVSALHVIRQPPPDGKAQKLDLWFAPSQQWYPVRLRFTDPDGDYIEQSLRHIAPTAR